MGKTVINKQLYKPSLKGFCAKRSSTFSTTLAVLPPFRYQIVYNIELLTAYQMCACFDFLSLKKLSSLNITCALIDCQFQTDQSVSLDVWFLTFLLCVYNCISRGKFSRLFLKNIPFFRRDNCDLIVSQQIRH